MRALAIVALFGCTSNDAGCDGGPAPGFVPVQFSDDIDDICSFDTCPLALGSEVMAIAEMDFTDAHIAPPELASVQTGDGTGLVIMPLAIGTGEIEAMFGVGDRAKKFSQTIRVAEVASTTIVPEDADLRRMFPDSNWPAGRLAVYANSTVRVVAVHNTAEGEHALGHGLETWSAQGAQLAPLPSQARMYADTDLERDVRVADVSPVTVSAGTDAAFVFDVVPPGSTALVQVTQGSLNPITVGIDELAFVSVRPFTADGRYILGPAPFSASSSDPHILEVAVSGDRELKLYGHAIGTAVVTTVFDGVTVETTVTMRY